jgi:hypothetical protein
MKHVKLFEQFIDEKVESLDEAKMSKTVELLADILSNFEDAFTEEEFVEMGVEDFKISAKTMKAIFNGYWDLEASDRQHNNAEDWAKWLKKNYNVK